MRLIILILALVSASAQDIFVPFFSVAGTTGNNLLTSLVAYYTFDEAAGVNAADSSGAGRSLTTSGATPNPGYVSPGRLGNAKSYTGGTAGSVDDTDYYKRTDAAFAFTGDFTIAGWIRADWNSTTIPSPHFTVTSMGTFNSTLAWMLIFDKPASDSVNMTFWWSFNGATALSVSTTPTTPAPVGVWIFCYAKRENTTISIAYTQAGGSALTTASSTTTTTSALSNTGQEMQVGNAALSTISDFLGDIDELGFWSRALSDCELRWLYKQGTGGPAFAGFDPNPCAPPTLP